MLMKDRIDLVSDGVLSVEQAAEFLKVSARYVYQILSDKRLIGGRIGKRWVVPKKSLLQFLADRVNLY